MDIRPNPNFSRPGRLNNQPADQPGQLRPSPLSTAPVPAAPSASPKSPQASGRLKRALILLAVALIAFAAGYYVRIIVDNSGSNTTANRPAAQTKSTTYAKGYRGGTAGVKLLLNADKMAQMELESVALYNKQNGQYPDTTNQYMLQMLWKYGYNAATAGPSLKCPDYNGYISYMPYKNQTTGKYDSFDFYYCRDTEVVKKTQADVPAQ